ncbi:MAG: 30S ribosomal protein S6 [Patescibacteria group bacterium]|nr:30S ribosomal protein S6 [Patescibacteria group bacterium]
MNTNRYELTYIVPTKYAEDELGGVIAQVRELVAKHGGKVTFEDNLGKKRLAYPIKQATIGYYLMAHFDLDPANLKALNRDLRLSSDVLRHLVAKRSEVVHKVAPAPVTTAATQATQEVRKQEEQSQAKLADLDRKLDELLTKDII